MQITLNKEQIEEIALSLFFTGFINERHGMKCATPKVMRFFIKQLHKNGLNEFLKLNSKNKPFVSDKIIKKTMLLVSLNDGYKIHDIDKVFDMAMAIASRELKGDK